MERPELTVIVHGFGRRTYAKTCKKLETVHNYIVGCALKERKYIGARPHLGYEYDRVDPPAIWGDEQHRIYEYRVKFKATVA